METTTLKMFSDTIRNENGLIWIAPVCEFFNLHVKNQYSKIKKDPILSKLVGKNRPVSAQNENLVGKNTPELGEIDKNGRIFLTKKGFLRWIQIINPNTLQEELRGKFILYQEMISDFLFGSFEEHEQLRMLNIRIQKLKKLRGEIGIELQVSQKQLTRALTNRYNYHIEFNQNKTLSK